MYKSLKISIFLFIPFVCLQCLYVCSCRFFSRSVIFIVRFHENLSLKHIDSGGKCLLQIDQPIITSNTMILQEQQTVYGSVPVKYQSINNTGRIYLQNTWERMSELEKSLMYRRPKMYTLWRATYLRRSKM
jgi:hypothetical protein